jgi:uncharacterized protein
MEDDQEQQPESLLPYAEWIEQALRQVVVRAIDHVAGTGMPGGHHFYLTFRTDHPGVVIPPHLRAQYPREMTIVLQHQFWDLKFIPETGVISVGLSFGGIPSTLVIPLEALSAFADPQVRYGLRFNPVMPEEKLTVVDTVAPDDKPSAGGAIAPVAPLAEDPGKKPAEAPQVVSLDAFRRRTPPKT